MSKRKRKDGLGLADTLAVNDVNNIKKDKEGFDIIYLDPNKLENHPKQKEIYGEFKERNDYESFTMSIKVNGIKEPLIVEKIADNRYRVIAGHGRRDAAIENGLTQVPCIIHDFLSEDDSTLLFHITNSDRKELTIMQKARLCKDKIELYERKKERGELNDHVGVRIKELVALELKDVGVRNRTEVNNLVTLTELIPEVQVLVDSGDIPQHRARVFAKLDKEDQKVMLEKIDIEEINKIKPKDIPDVNEKLKDELAKKDHELNKLKKQIDESNNSEEVDKLTKQLTAMKNDKITAEKLVKSLQDKVQNFDPTNSEEFVKLQNDYQTLESKLNDMPTEPTDPTLSQEYQNLQNELIEAKKKIDEFKNKTEDEFIKSIKKSVAEILVPLSNLKDMTVEFKKNSKLTTAHEDELKKIKVIIDEMIG